jgi:hypothetical protein
MGKKAPKPTLVEPVTTAVAVPATLGKTGAEAIAAFREMLRLEARCTCPPISSDEKYFVHEECAACDAWWQQHGILVAELRLKPWEFPAIEDPEAASPYPEGSEAWKNDKPDVEAQARYRALAQAVAEADKKRIF